MPLLVPVLPALLLAKCLLARSKKRKREIGFVAHRHGQWKEKERLCKMRRLNEDLKWYYPEGWKPAKAMSAKTQFTQPEKAKSGMTKPEKARSQMFIAEMNIQRL